MAIDTSLINIDVHRFEQHYQLWRSHKHEASIPYCQECLTHLNDEVDLYHEDFLADFYLSDANEFNEWVVAFQQSLRRQKN